MPTTTTTPARYLIADPPLPGRSFDWMTDLFDQPGQLRDLVAKHGSPLNVHRIERLVGNAEELRLTAESHQVRFQIFFARKANKCLAYVEAARRIGIGVDTASENELRQVIDAGVPPERIICTAAVKSDSLLQFCVRHGITVAIDNDDEWEVAATFAGEKKRTLPVAVRIGGFSVNGRKLDTRFGIDADTAADWLAARSEDPHLRVVGFHFHLDGYRADERIAAIDQSLTLIEHARGLGHEIDFLDMGGGFPMCYLENEQDWISFWDELHRANRGEREPITRRNVTFGRVADDTGWKTPPRLYPYWQTPTRGAWLDGILSAPRPSGSGETIAEGVRNANLELRCEPGRALLDGCGFTAARVEFRKQTPDGDWQIGLAMNRTQCRTSSLDFLVDPILVPAGRSTDSPPPMSGYLVGAYCMESEFLTHRRLHFPHGVRRGDLVIFPNTAGYLMHFLESRSHQFPLAKNLIVEGDRLRLDRIEGE